jgi:hypothetical protein
MDKRPFIAEAFDLMNIARQVNAMNSARIR